MVKVAALVGAVLQAVLQARLIPMLMDWRCLSHPVPSDSKNTGLMHGLDNINQLKSTDYSPESDETPPLCECPSSTFGRVTESQLSVC